MLRIRGNVAFWGLHRDLNKMSTMDPNAMPIFGTHRHLSQEYHCGFNFASPYL